MSSAYQRQQIAKLCAKDETIKDANELLNIALAKTGPGSGHDLGKNTIALPAICALLASERLGNNDVVKRVAQDVSCLKPLHFETALGTVRGALSGHLSRRHGSDISYKSLCDSHGLNEDALYWMEEVEKELRRMNDLETLDVDEETILYVVFYWTCIALNIRSVKRANIISDYGVPFHIFQNLEKVLDSTCDNLKETMGKFINESRTSRTTTATHSKPSGKGRHAASERVSSSKTRAAPSLTPFSTPTKTPTKAASSREALDISPSKRKVVLPPLPFMTPTKKQRTTSPVKLNRIPVTTNLSTPSKSTAVNATSETSPFKTYGSARSFLDSPTKSTSRKSAEEESKLARSRAEAVLEKELVAEPPVTPVRNRIDRRSIVEERTPVTPSPRKSARLRTSVAAPFTPTRRKSLPSKYAADSDVEMKEIQTENASDVVSESSEDEEERLPPCRHYVPVFADRLFYDYRDPRTLREWEACEKIMKTLVLEH